MKEEGGRKDSLEKGRGNYVTPKDPGCLSIEDDFLEAGVGQETRIIPARSSSPTPTHCEGLSGACQSWLPSPHLQTLPRPISSSFAATLGQWCAGVCLVALPPECGNLLSASSPVPHQLARPQKRLLISLCRGLASCRCVLYSGGCV